MAPDERRRDAFDLFALAVLGHGIFYRGVRYRPVFHGIDTLNKLPQVDIGVWGWLAFIHCDLLGVGYSYGVRRGASVAALFAAYLFNSYHEVAMRTSPILAS